jgi:hypothetical protein
MASSKPGIAVALARKGECAHANEAVAEPFAIAIHCVCASIRKGVERPSTGYDRVVQSRLV